MITAKQSSHDCDW